MSSEVSSIQGKSISSKNIITYSLVLLTFLVALWLSFQSEGPVSYTHLTLPTIE